MPAFYEFVLNLFHNITFFRIGALLGLPTTVILLVMFIRKKNRDERGWKIIGKASVIAFLYLMIIVNVIAKIVGAMEFPHEEIGYLFFASMLQWLYDTVSIIEIAAILVFRKLE